MALHLRARGLPAREVLAIAVRIAPVAAASGSLLLLNDRVDLAMALGVDGVQLGSRSMPVADARRILGAQAWIGASVHSAAGGARAAAEGADFLLAGTLFATTSHPGRPGSGTAWLGDLRIPAIGIGGITPERVPEVRSAGAAGVAVLRAVWEAENPATSVRALLAAL